MDRRERWWLYVVLNTMNVNTLKQVESISNFPIQPTRYTRLGRCPWRRSSLRLQITTRRFQE